MSSTPLPLNDHCPVCASSDTEVFLRKSELPVCCHGLFDDPATAQRSPRGELELCVCSSCGLIFNRSFDPQLLVYQEGYENAQHFSPRFRQYLETLAAELKEQLPHDNNTIVELGCGDGVFLKMLCSGGANRGIGFDPAADVSSTLPTDNVRIFDRPFTEVDAHVACDLVCARHLLEHLTDPASLLRLSMQALDERQGAIYLEVPSADYMLRNGAIWDLLYEHCLYFTSKSLRHMLLECGFEDVHLQERFGGQFLTAIARVGTSGVHRGQAVAEQDATENRRHDHEKVEVDRFAQVFRETVATASDCIQRQVDANRRIAVWGAGTKGIMLLNTIACANDVTALIDVNPRKWGRHIPGVGIPIVAPHDVGNLSLDTVFVTNAIYETEIRQQLAAVDQYPDLLVV